MMKRHVSRIIADSAIPSNVRRIVALLDDRVRTLEAALKVIRHHNDMVAIHDVCDSVVSGNMSVNASWLIKMEKEGIPREWTEGISLTTEGGWGEHERDKWGLS